MSVIVRDARRDELPPLALAAAQQTLLVRYHADGARLGADLQAALDRGEPILVAEHDGAAAGFAWYLPHGGLGLGAYLRLIALAPGSEGHGLGTALMDELERRVAAASRHLFLLVSHFNDGARRFYAARGYRECGLLPGIVRPEIDEIICWKRLRGP